MSADLIEIKVWTAPEFAETPTAVKWSHEQVEGVFL
jgi:hypothetical protein